MKNIQIKSLYFIMYLLLLPHLIVGMKRQGSPQHEGPQKKQKTHDNFCPHVSGDLWQHIALQDLSILKPLQQTCFSINRALESMTLDSLSALIANNPQTAQGIAQNFYICTKLLYKFGHNNENELFTILWNSQSANDKGLRTDFVNTLKRMDLRFVSYKITKIQFFGEPTLRENQLLEEKMRLLTYLFEALEQKNSHLVHLATASFLYKHVANKFCLSNGYGFWHAYNKEADVLRGAYLHAITYPLLKACQDSTVECLQILLDYNTSLDTTLTKKSILQIVLERAQSKPIDNLSEKIKLLLQYYVRQHLDCNTILNQAIQEKTPLLCTLDLFVNRKICVNELLVIFKLLIEYGANPNFVIIKPRASGTISSNTFDIIGGHLKEQKISQEEADIIIDCLQSTSTLA